MDKNALVISKRLKFPYNGRTDKNIKAPPKMNLQSFLTDTPDSLNHRQPKLTLRSRIMLRNSGHGENIRVCMGIFTTGFRR